METLKWNANSVYVHLPCQTLPHPYIHIATFLQPLNAGIGLASESVNEDEIPQKFQKSRDLYCFLFTARTLRPLAD